MARPIFVVGSPRSGTTGLANALCQHRDIAGIQSPEHYGIHESHFFSMVKGRYGDISNPSNFIEFVEAFAASDYFILSGVEKELIYSRRPQTYEEFFRILMDEFARRKGTQFWLEKTPHHSVYIYEIAGYYPDSRFIAIKRGILDTIKSDVKLHYDPSSGYFAGEVKIPRSLLLIYLVFRYHMYYKHIESFCRKHPDRCMLVSFEEFTKLKESTFRRICDFLGIPFDPRMLEEPYKRNTSFSSEIERRRTLKRREEVLISAFDKIARVIPFVVYRMAARIYKKKMRSRPYPSWFYRMKVKELGKPPEHE